MASAQKRWRFSHPTGKAECMSLTENACQLTADLCRSKAKECLYMAHWAASQSHRIMLEHIAETWYSIANSLPANDA